MRQYADKCLERKNRPFHRSFKQYALHFGDEGHSENVEWWYVSFVVVEDVSPEYDNGKN